MSVEYKYKCDICETERIKEWSGEPNGWTTSTLKWQNYTHTAQICDTCSHPHQAEKTHRSMLSRIFKGKSK